MTSFDIEALFTDNPLEETVNICVEKLFQNKTKVNNLTKECFQSFLELVTLDYFKYKFIENLHLVLQGNNVPTRLQGANKVTLWIAKHFFFKMWKLPSFRRLGSSLFHSITIEGKKKFFKKLYLIINKGTLSIFLVLKAEFRYETILERQLD